jgi:hypothetical protein
MNTPSYNREQLSVYRYRTTDTIVFSSLNYFGKFLMMGNENCFTTAWHEYWYRCKFITNTDNLKI